MLDFLKKLVGGGERAPEAADPVEYGGYQIVAAPRQVSGGWSTEGVIRGQVDGEDREASFIRADTCMTREDAVDASRAKARKIIDERGAAVFNGDRL
jgi:hypothetical protein